MWPPTTLNLVDSASAALSPAARPLAAASSAPPAPASAPCATPSPAPSAATPAALSPAPSQQTRATASTAPCVDPPATPSRPSTRPSAQSCICPSSRRASSPRCSSSLGSSVSSRPDLTASAWSTCVASISTRRAHGGRAAAAASSIASIRANHPAARVSVCAALLISTWIRPKRAHSSSQKRSTSPTSDSSRGPRTSNLVAKSPKSGSCA
mmetsp:Transcript_9872/g.21063  ORF Transcript_9872/g.21063 Transcript_9872/m.21063 type:complete len:211 (+) Transcript_9872:1122-1754(+)